MRQSFPAYMFDMKAIIPAALALSVSMGLSSALAHDHIGAVSPALEKYAQGPITELWRRPGLAPRDRSIVTVAALIAGNQSIELPDQIGLALDNHLNRAMNNGLKAEEAGEMLTQLAFYAGWPRVFSALPVVKEVIEKRQK